ncbi:hypothetical protein MSAN_01094500 [Mycena sanguinolenta]|uniref:Secreted protein n=1 Tax=Mycena sanguinolenta TaxID=230812 RepID=A0A8H6YT16_9AGAR|nr:hypothetical protein MSAN_01094500 [Mycena sanguinolenta]
MAFSFSSCFISSAISLCLCRSASLRYFSRMQLPSFQPHVRCGVVLCTTLGSSRWASASGNSVDTCATAAHRDDGRRRMAEDRVTGVCGAIGSLDPGSLSLVPLLR